MNFLHKVLLCPDLYWKVCGNSILHYLKNVTGVKTSLLNQNCMWYVVTKIKVKCVQNLVLSTLVLIKQILILEFMGLTLTRRDVVIQKRPAFD